MGDKPRGGDAREDDASEDDTTEEAAAGDETKIAEEECPRA